MHSTIGLCLSAAVAVTATSNSKISAVSWDSGRLDVFGNAPDKSIWHKYWIPTGFEPYDHFENLGGSIKGSPAAISWAPGRLDLFAVGEDHSSVHTYWDGSNWAKLENLKGEFQDRVLAAATWSVDRLDVVGRDFDNRIIHKYWDSTKWVPWASFGGDFQAEPSVTSWGKNRLDIFGVDLNGTVLHQFWSGETWLADWEPLPGPVQFFGTPFSSTMASGRLDVWATGEDGQLYHTFWAPNYYSGWESLGGTFTHEPQVIHWSDNRIDIVGKFHGETQYRYKYWDGSQWNPSHDTWYEKGGDFASQPALASRGDQNLNIFGIATDGTLKWQFWNAGQWLPSPTEYYSLGNTSAPYPPKSEAGSDSTKGNDQIVFGRYRSDM